MISIYDYDTPDDYFDACNRRDARIAREIEAECDDADRIQEDIY